MCKTKRIWLILNQPLRFRVLQLLNGARRKGKVFVVYAGPMAGRVGSTCSVVDIVNVYAFLHVITI